MVVEVALGATLLCAAIEDGKQRTISDWWVMAVFLLAGIATVIGKITLASALIGVLVVGGSLLLGAMLTNSVGGGDVKLCAALGALCGAVSALIIIIYSLIVMILISKLRRVKESAFAPFLFVGFLIYMSTKNLM